MNNNKLIVFIFFAILSVFVFYSCNQPYDDTGMKSDSALIEVSFKPNACTSPGCIKNKPFFNIAHMTNLKSAVDYAISVKANAIEMDMNFDDEGIPTDFRHGWPCDCTCSLRGHSSRASICKA